MQALFDLLARCWAWWIGELASCVPPALRRMLSTTPRALLLGWQENTLELKYRGRSGWGDLGKIAVDLVDTAGMRAAFIEATRGIPARRAALVMELPAGRAFQRQIDLPLTAKDSLRSVIGYELDRLTPFRAETAAFDYRIVAIDRATKRIALRIVAVPRSVIAQAENIGRALGVVPDRIGVAVDGNASFNLAPVAATSQATWLSRRALVGLAGLAALLIAVAVLLPLQRKHEILAAYEARLSENRKAAAEVAALRDQMVTSLEQGNFVLLHRRTRPLTVTMLKDLTDLIGDDTFLTELRLDGGEIVLSGSSPAAARLIPTLEASPVLSEVHFTAPVTTDIQSDKERFSLVARIPSAEGP